MRRLTLAVLCLAAIATTPVTPAAAQTTYEIRMELSTQAKAADRQLNLVYKQLMANLKPKARQALTRSQLAWLAFREAEVAAESDQYRGGTMQPILALNCDIRLLKQRSRELELWLVQASNADDPYPPRLLPKLLSEQKGVYAQADHLLNQAYRDYLRLNDADNRKLMTKAELAWIAFRDLEAAFAALIARSQAEAPLARVSTLAALTGTRAEELAAMVKELESR